MMQQFIRYAIIGMINTILDFGIYIGLTRGFEFWANHYLLANAITFMVVVTWSFFWNKYWTFKNQERKHARQYIKFVITTLVGIGIAEAILFLGVDIILINDLLAKVVATPLIMSWNFCSYRFWAFRNQKDKVLSPSDAKIDEIITSPPVN